MKIVVWIWTIVVGAMGLGAVTWNRSPSFVLNWTIFAVGFAPMALMIRSQRRRRAQWNELVARMLDAAGVAPGSGFEHAEDGTAIALNARARTLTLLRDGSWKTYPFADVREWSTRIVTADQYLVGGSVLGGAAAMSSNASARREAAADSGLFVRVRDVQRPEWRVSMVDRDAQARWMEILDQAINEGRRIGEPAAV
jgi:hypothetical protein